MVRGIRYWNNAKQMGKKKNNRKVKEKNKVQNGSNSKLTLTNPFQTHQSQPAYSSNHLHQLIHATAVVQHKSNLHYYNTSSPSHFLLTHSTGFATFSHDPHSSPNALDYERLMRELHVSTKMMNKGRYRDRGNDIIRRIIISKKYIQHPNLTFLFYYTLIHLIRI